MNLVLNILSKHFKSVSIFSNRFSRHTWHMVVTDTHNTLHIRWQNVEPWGQHTPQRVTAYSHEMLHLSTHIQGWELAVIDQILGLIILSCRWLHGTNSWVLRCMCEFNWPYHGIYCKIFLNFIPAKLCCPKAWCTQSLSLHLISFFLAFFHLYYLLPIHALPFLSSKGLPRERTIEIMHTKLANQWGKRVSSIDTPRNNGY